MAFVAFVTRCRNAGSHVGRVACGGTMPLSFVIARYFVYAFFAVALTWVIAFAALSAVMRAGLAYEASWGPANARDIAGRLAAEPSVDERDIPTAYRYLIVDGEGEVRSGNVDERLRQRVVAAARSSLGAAAGDVAITGGGAGVTFAAFPLASGGACALVSSYLPHWVDHEMARALPNPQNVMLIAGVLGSAVALALVARRASRVLTAKMAPLGRLAEQVGRQELDGAVEPVNVREINDVLRAMDAMRTSLADSLEARWSAERAQRDQLASLAHDLKTPLTVVRANAEYVHEMLQEDGVQSANDKEEVAAAAHDVICAADRLDGYVTLLIETARREGTSNKVPMEPRDLCGRVIDDARALAQARGIAFEAHVDPAIADVPPVLLDGVALARAVENLASNAAGHARARMRLECSHEEGALRIEVLDDGPGLSPAALEHGMERFFTDDAARGRFDGERHYGLGLHTAAVTARDHGGEVLLRNHLGPGGSIMGAEVTLVIPLSDDRELGNEASGSVD